MTAVEFIESCEQMATKDGYDELVAFYANQQFCKDLVKMVNKPIPELSDEEIIKAIHKIYGRDNEDFLSGADWYREQLKQRQ